MKKFFVIISVFTGFLVLASVFLALNTNYFNKSIEINKFDKIKTIVHIKKNIVAKSWTNFVKIQKNLSSKIAVNLKKTKSGNFLLYFLISFGMAFIYGILHSIGPGHGKMIVMSYFLTEKAKLLEVPVMAIQIAGTHILSAVIMVFLADISLRQILTNSIDKVYWIKIISYSLIIFIGIIFLLKKTFEQHIKKNVVNFNRGFLSVAAGMIPCTGALLILIFAMANDMIIMGIMLVIAIGLGIAATLSSVGIITMMTKNIVTAETVFTKGKNISIALEYLGIFIIISLGIIMLTLTISG